MTVEDLIRDLQNYHAKEKVCVIVDCGGVRKELVIQAVYESAKFKSDEYVVKILVSEENRVL